MLDKQMYKKLLSEGKIIKTVRETYINYDLIIEYNGFPVLANVQRSIFDYKTSVNWMSSEETIDLILQRSLELRHNAEVVVDKNERRFVVSMIKKATRNKHNEPQSRNYATFAIGSNSEFPNVHEITIDENNTVENHITKFLN